MKDIIGLAVLTSPLFLVVPWLVVAVLVAVKAAQLPKMRVAKLAAGAATLVVIFLLPFSDGIAGRIYFNHLCSTEAGVKVYQTMQLPAEFWDAQGKANFFNEHGYLDHEFWVSKLDESGGRVESYSSIFAIDKVISPVKERISQKQLAEVTTFHFWGGWIKRNLSLHNTASTCEFIDAPDFSRNFYGQLFKPVPLH